jgi:hypothetical protein
MAFQYSVLFLGAFSQQASARRRISTAIHSIKGRSTMSIRRIVIGLFAMYAVLLIPARAHAQFTATPFSDPATGERYHIEASGVFWNPPPDFSIASESLGQVGTTINAVTDLGIEQKRIAELRIVLRPGRKHKFRVNYLPMSYSASATVKRAFVFNGIRYNLNIPVSTELSWKTWQLGYEYDFIYRDRWFVGFVIQAKATDINATLTAPIGVEFARVQAPIPTLGGIARVYVVPNISITGEFLAFKIPETIDERYQSHYFDFDLYGTINFNDYVGAQIGYRRLDLGYVIEEDRGDFKAKGIYFGGVVRY